MYLFDETEYPLIYSNPSFHLYVWDAGDKFFIREGLNEFVLPKTIPIMTPPGIHTFSIYDTVNGDIIFRDLNAKKQIKLGHAITQPSAIYSKRTPSEYTPHIETESSATLGYSPVFYYPSDVGKAERYRLRQPSRSSYSINK